MNYNESIASAPVVLVEFFATWCPHCQKMMPVVEKVKEQLDGKVPVVQFDIDKNEADADKVKVEVVPTFIVYADGKEVWRHSGEIDGTALLDKVKEYL